GLKKEDFKLNLTNNRLTISAQHQSETAEENKDEKYTRHEFSYRSFQRTFTLPQSVNGEAVEATYTDGILHVNLPTREEAKVKPAREIAIA
ncbi:MAG: Hsp20/alpha crystallin family protein, partial [Sphingobacteriaceae bacterium]|nr:Hsp20/alpha crystallin family protein [Cytophagaceae bacterium]